MVKVKITTALVTLATLSLYCSSCAGSAIPMWEYLSRGEKMSHLYSMFAKQVSNYCKTTINVPIAQCKRNLLVYGVDKLEKMSDSHLDAMDPYQRGASDIIWDSMMKGHPSMSSKVEESTPLPILEPTGEYERNPLFDDHSDSEKPQKRTTGPSGSGTLSSGYAADMDMAYGQPTGSETAFIDPQNYLAAASSLDLHYDLPSETVASTTNFLSGPMVIRVRPDGSPVEEDRFKPLPRDDDREAMTIGKNKIPTAQEIVNDFGSARRIIAASYRTYDRRLTNSH